MDEFTRRVLAADDAHRRRQPEDGLSRRGRRGAAQWQDSGNINSEPPTFVTKTMENGLSSASTMAATTQAAWDAWVHARIMALLEPFSGAIGEEVAITQREQRATQMAAAAAAQPDADTRWN